MTERQGRSAAADDHCSRGSEARPSVLIVGCSGHARVVIDIVELEGKYRVVGLIDSFKHSGTRLLGYEVIGTEEDIPALAEAGVASLGIVAIGDNWTRARVVDRIRDLQPDFQFVNAIHPDVCIASDVRIGEGTVVMAGAVINTGCTIGAFCLLNTRCSVDHECTLGEYSSLAPGVVTGGRVVIGPFSAVGIGATIIHEVQIGDHAVIGAGATLLNDVPDQIVAYGTPARIVRSRNIGDPYLVHSAKVKNAATSPVPPVRPSLSPDMQLFSTDDDDWSRCLEDIPHDFFHTREYLRRWTDMRGGEGLLAIYGRPDKFVAWPYVLQNINGFDCTHGKSVYDAPAIFGSTGPLMRGCGDDLTFLQSACTAMTELWRTQSVVTAVSQFHPILAGCAAADAVQSSGGTLHDEKTVVLDLTEEDSWNEYTLKIRESLLAASDGVRVVHDPEWHYLEDFIRLHYATIKRGGREDVNYFTKRFFNGVKAAAGDHASLIVALKDDRVISAALVVEFRHIASVLLLSTDADYETRCPGRIIFCDVQAWARNRGNSYLHVAGGRGIRRPDELFRRDYLPAKLLLPLYTGHWIIDEQQYRELVSETHYNAGVRREHGAYTMDFFPEYRAPMKHV